jgi:hypothetical protein
MPYELVKVNEARSLYKVCKSDDKNKCFSKKGLRKFVAVKQKKAIELNERRRKVGGSRRRKRLRSSDHFSNGKWKTLYEQYVEYGKSLGVERPLDIDSFKARFNDIWEHNQDDSYTTVQELAQADYDAENKEEDESSGSEEMVKARTMSSVSERQTEMNDEEFEKKKDELSRRFYLGEVSKPMKYIVNPYFNPNLPPTAYVGDNQINKIKNEIYILESDLLDQETIDEGLSKTKILSEDVITRKIENGDCYRGQPEINVEILQNTYDYLVEISRNQKDFTKQRMGFFVDASKVGQGNLPNEDAIVGLTSIIQYIGGTDNICVDKCEPDDPYRFSVFGGEERYGIVLYVDKNEDIIITSGADIRTQGNDDDLHINYLCGSNYTYAMFDAYKRMAKTGKDYFWNVGTPFSRLSLMSVSTYNTVNFYFKQGLRNEKSQNDYRERFQRYLKQRLNDDDYRDNVVLQLKFLNGLKQIFERPICRRVDVKKSRVKTDKKGKRLGVIRYTETIPNSKILNDIYAAAGCGGDKFYDGNTSFGDDYFNFDNFFAEEIGYKIGDLTDELDSPEEIRRRGRTALSKFARNVKATKFNIADTVKKMKNEGKLDIILPKSDIPDQFPKSNLKIEFEKRPEPSRQQVARNQRALRQYEETGDRRRELASELKEGDEVEDIRTRILEAFNRRQNFNESGLADIKTGEGIKGAKFDEELRRYGINPTDYLNQMKKWAKASGYDEKQLTLDNNDKNKLRIMTEEGTKHFGRVGYKDYYIYRHLEKEKKVKKGYAKIMRDRFRKSHGAISKKRKLGRNSANELSLRILWHEDDDEKDKRKNNPK